MTTIIRQAAVEDLALVQRLNAALYEYEDERGFYDDSYDLGWTYGEAGESYFRRCLSDDDASSVVLVAEDDGTAVGYLAGGISTYVYRSTNPIAEIHNMCVLEERRGSGVGTQLVESFTQWARYVGAQRVKVAAFAANSAVAFYEACGFQTHEVVLEQRL